MGFGSSQPSNVSTTSEAILSPEQQELINTGMPFVRGFTSNPPTVPTNTVQGFDPMQRLGQNMALDSSDRQAEIAQNTQRAVGGMLSGGAGPSAGENRAEQGLLNGANNLPQYNSLATTPGGGGGWQAGGGNNANLMANTMGLQAAPPPNVAQGAGSGQMTPASTQAALLNGQQSGSGAVANQLAQGTQNTAQQQQGINRLMSGTAGGSVPGQIVDTLRQGVGLGGAQGTQDKLLSGTAGGPGGTTAANNLGQNVGFGATANAQSKMTAGTAGGPGGQPAANALGQGANIGGQAKQGQQSLLSGAAGKNATGASVGAALAKGANLGGQANQTQNQLLQGQAGQDYGSSGIINKLAGGPTMGGAQNAQNQLLQGNAGGQAGNQASQSIQQLMALMNGGGMTGAEQTANNKLLGGADMGAMQGSGADVASFLLNPNLLKPGSNPALQGAIDAATRPIQENLMREVLPELRNQAVGSGNFGSSRSQLGYGLAAGEAAKAMGDTGANIANQGYQSGLQALTSAFGTESNRQNDVRNAMLGALGLGNERNQLASQSMTNAGDLASGEAARRQAGIASGVDNQMQMQQMAQQGLASAGQLGEARAGRQLDAMTAGVDSALAESGLNLQGLEASGALGESMAARRQAGIDSGVNNALDLANLDTQRLGMSGELGESAANRQQQGVQQGIQNNMDMLGLNTERQIASGGLAENTAARQQAGMQAGVNNALSEAGLDLQSTTAAGNLAETGAGRQQAGISDALGFGLQRDAMNQAGLGAAGNLMENAAGRKQAGQTSAMQMEQGDRQMAINQLMSIFGLQQGDRTLAQQGINASLDRGVQRDSLSNQATLGGIGQSQNVQQTMLNPALTTSGVGDVRQQQNQAELTGKNQTDYQRQLMPLMIAQELAGLAAGTPGGSAINTGPGAQQPGLGQRLMGGAGVGAGLMGAGLGPLGLIGGLLMGLM